MDDHSRLGNFLMRRPKVFISLLILLVIGLHALPVLSYQGNRQTRWPFLAWAMYAKSLPPGPIQTMSRRVVGITLKGDRDAVTPELVGLGEPTFRKMYLRALYEGDDSTARALASWLNRQRDDPYVELRLEGEKFTLADTGVVKEELPVRAYRIDPSRSR